MNIKRGSSDGPRSLKLWPETLEWLKQQQNPSETIDMLVASARKAEQQPLKDDTKVDIGEVSAVEEQLQISQEQVKTLQAELNAETDRAETYREELAYIKQQLCDRVVRELQGKLSTAQMSRVELGVLAQKVMYRETKKDDKSPMEAKNWFALRSALNRFIAILLN